MLDIQKMIITNDFSDLIHSTEEERQISGGDNYLYSQLADYLQFNAIKVVARDAFKNNSEILAHMNEQFKEKNSEVVRTKVTHNNVDYFIQLPQ